MNHHLFGATLKFVAVVVVVRTEAKNISYQTVYSHGVYEKANGGISRPRESVLAHVAR